MITYNNISKNKYIKWVGNKVLNWKESVKHKGRQ